MTANIGSDQVMILLTTVCSNREVTAALLFQ